MITTNGALQYTLLKYCFLRLYLIIFVLQDSVIHFYQFILVCNDRGVNVLGIELFLFLCSQNRLVLNVRIFSQCGRVQLHVAWPGREQSSCHFIGAFEQKMFNRQMRGKRVNLTLRSVAWLKSFPIRGIYFGLDGTVSALRTLAKYASLLRTICKTIFSVNSTRLIRTPR